MHISCCVLFKLNVEKQLVSDIGIKLNHKKFFSCTLDCMQSSEVTEVRSHTELYFAAIYSRLEAELGLEEGRKWGFFPLSVEVQHVQKPKS